MPNQKRKCLPLFLIAPVTILLIFFTRMVTLSHNLHPDEHVFYLSANSLLNSILHPGTTFEEYMEYPEGAYLFHAVFQFFGKIFRVLTGEEQQLQIWGRIASVCYFSVAVLLGMNLVARYLGKTPVSATVYGLTMCFSLFFMEQSRYGTGDMISLMLLMLLLILTAQAMTEGRKPGWWLAAFLVCGILGAVKYPLLEYNGGTVIQPGQLIITGAQKYHLGQSYLLPVDPDAAQTIRQWSAFQEANQDWLVGQIYPDYYYYLTGGWLRGGTLSQYEFPCSCIYYRAQ